METIISPEAQQADLLERLTQPQPTVIGIEGGPCGGKSTLIEAIKAQAGDRKVICLPEAATEHITALAAQGIDFADVIEGNRPLFLETEAKILRSIVDNIQSAVAENAGTDAIIIADRCDIGAYVSNQEHAALLESVGLSMPPMLTHVDQLYYLPSLARINSKRYEELKSSNPARYENSKEASEVCLRNQAAVARHPELHIAVGKDFEQTVSHLVGKILEPDRENEIKLEPISDDTPVNVPMFKALGKTLAVSEVEQSYHEHADLTFRLRRCTTELGETILSFTVKTGEGISRKELQRRLDQDTFDILSRCKQVGKTLLKQRTAMLLIGPDNVKRMWTVDRNYDRRLPEWNLETDVVSEVEADEVLSVMRPYKYELSPWSAEKLARSLGEKAILS